MIKEICPDNAKIVDLQTKQQQNDKDCGPFIVDNLTKMAKGKDILTTEKSKKNMGSKLRNGHAETMNIVESIYHASLLSKDSSCKAAFYKEIISKTNFATGAEEHNFYNYDLDLLGDVVPPYIGQQMVG